MTKAAAVLVLMVAAATCATPPHVHASPSHGPVPSLRLPARHRVHAGGARAKAASLQDSHPLTVVSAFYPGPAKHSDADYAQWGVNFMQMRAPVVVFTDDVASIPAARARPRATTHVIIKQPDDFFVSTLGFDWDAQLATDPERYIHSVHLFRVWLEKTAFVMQAVRINVFRSAYFAWVDYGYFRNRRADTPPWAPTPAALAPGRLLLLNTSSLHANPAKTIGGGAMAGDVAAWRAWNRTFYETLVASQAAGMFVGDDQTTMTQVARAHPNLTCVVKPQPGFGDAWFFLKAVLDGRAACGGGGGGEQGGGEQTGQQGGGEGVPACCG